VKVKRKQFKGDSLLGYSTVQSLEVHRCFRGVQCFHHQGDDGDSMHLKLSVSYETTWHYITEDCHVYTLCHMNLKSYKFSSCLLFMFFRKHYSCALPSDVIPTASVRESDGLPSVCSAFVLQFEINILLKFQTTALSGFGNLFYVSCTSVLPFETEFANP
jgi:hypothetical protein